MHRTALVIAVLVVLAIVPAGGLAGNEGAPLADAGLDQPAEVGETVLLDSTGSRDPDGRIETYEWHIETPDGQSVTPADPTDPRTRFVVRQPGRYEVTVTVTDDTGKRAADTLYVYVDGRGGSETEGGDPWGWEIDLPKPIDESDTLIIEGSDLTYKEDIVYRSYSDNGKLPGREMGDGENPLNEFNEFVTGVGEGLIQPVVGTKEMTFSYQIAGETAREMEGMTDYSTGDKEDEIAEKLNTRSDAPAVLEDYVLNDAKVIDGVSDTADTVRVIIRVRKNKNVLEYGAATAKSGTDVVAYAGDTATSVLLNMVTEVMNR